jgi:hypothetical protein
MRFKNSQGKVYYGMHFYPGVAEYAEPNADPYRIFINEDTIRKMDPTFAGRPIFVLHVDEVETNLDKLREEADGWVIESFYNEADGKHWAKFIVVSEKAERAIARGYRLSNCYRATGFADGGQWNGVSYAKEVKGGEYEHLAIVPNPRYEESVVMSPDEFKKYNEEKRIELKRLANTKRGVGEMKLKLFKRAKVENSVDLEEMLVILPKSNREVSIVQLVNEADEHEMKKSEPQMANGEHCVNVGDEKMTVNELLEKHKMLKDELEKMKSKGDDDKQENEDEEDEDKHENEEDDEDKHENEEDDGEADADDKDAKKKALELAEHEDKEMAERKKKNAKEKADRLRNAQRNEPEAVVVELAADKVARGKARYGS